MIAVTVRYKNNNMPDITMCNGVGCYLRDKCYRYTAKPSFRQPYFMNEPIEDGKCKEFWKKV